MDRMQWELLSSGTSFDRVRCCFLPFFFKFQDEFLDVVYWSRQVLGIIIGIFWGIFPLKGLIALVL